MSWSSSLCILRPASGWGSKGPESSQLRTTAPTTALAQVKRQFVKNVTPSAQRRNSNAVHPICPSTADSLALANHDSTSPLDTESIQKSQQRSCSLHRLQLQILHGLDLANPCSVKSTYHKFLPTATIMFSLADLEIDQQRSFTAVKHARNHSAWRASDSLLKLEISEHSSAAERASQLETGPGFSVKVSVSSVCRHRKGVAMDASHHIGETEDISLPFKREDYEFAQFLTVWRRLGHNSALRPVEAGRIKLRVRVQAKQLAVQPESRTRKVISAPHQEQVKPRPTGRPSFLPKNFADALVVKRKQLRATVAPDSVRESEVDREQFALDSQERDRANSERVLQEMVRDTTLTQFSASQVEILEQIGQGVHSSVLHGRLTGAAFAGAEASSLPIDVAVKEFRYRQPFPPPKVLDTFRHEFQLLEKCSREGAHGIVRYFGVLLSPRPSILTEFFRSGRCVQCAR